MALFTGIGDFFRGVFGEDDEEKRRRKQREQQEAAARRAQASQPKPQITPVNNQPPKQVQDLFKPKTNPDPLGVTTKLQQTQPAQPKPKPALPDEEFKALTTKGTENKKILGWNAAAVLPKAYEKVDKVAVDRNYSTNKDKYVAEFDRLDEGRKQILINESRKLAEKGDKAATRTLQVLEETNRIKKGSLPKDKLQTAADYASVPGRSILRVGTGMAQGVSGLYDLATPGEGTSRTSKFINKVAENQDKSAKEAGVEKAYKITNVPVEIASYLLPSTLAAKLGGKLPKGAKLTEDLAERIAKTVDNGGDANKVRQFLANRVRQNMTLDEVLEEAAISARYMGQNTARGGDTSPQSVATDVAAGIGGGLLFPGRRIRQMDAEDIPEEALGGATSAASNAPDMFDEILDDLRRGRGDEVTQTGSQATVEQAQQALEEKGLRNVTDSELKALADNEDAIALDRKRARDELIRRADEAEQVTNAADPLNRPAFQHKRDVENVINAEEQKLNDFLNNNPGLSRQQIEAAVEAARQRTEKLVQELNDSRYAAMRAVEKQGDEASATVQAGQEAVQAAEDVKAAATTPSPQAVVETPPASPSPEVQANDAYRVADDLFDNTPAEVRDDLSMWQRFSPDRAIRENITRPLEAGINRGISALQRSDNRAARGVGRLFTGFSREAGVTPELQTARMKLRGGVETGKINREAIADLSKGVADESRERIWATLDPEFAARMGKSVDNLTPEETIIRDKLKTIIDSTTQENLRRGLITPEQAANGSYIKRAYSVYDGVDADAKKFESQFRQELMNQFKGRKQVSDEMLETAITDPTYLVGKKTAESEAIWAMQDYGNFLAKNGDVSPTARPGYTQLPDSPVFGEAAGKFVPRNIAEDFTGFQYTNAMTSAFNDLVTAYDRWGLRQAKKQILTVFNPAVRLGNQVTNRGIFSQLSGTNPLQFNAVYTQVGNMIKQNHPLYREAVSQGLTGVDITNADFYAQRIAQATGDANQAKKALQWFQKSYSNADDKARITSYVIKRQQGYSPEEAARQVQRGFQDYKSVGYFYDLAAKTPVIGNAFVRFAADSMRIAKNAAVDHPLRSAATVALWANFVNIMSAASGESKDDKQAREDRFGAPKLPFTDISLTVQTPFGEVNVARFAPWYSLSEISSTEVAKFLPVSQSPVRVQDGKLGINPAAMQDPLLGQFVQLGMDEDFRGKSIQDPENTGGDRFAYDELSGEDKRNNALRFLFNQNVPLGREADAIKSAATGEEDIYGKSRSVPQAIARAFGFKVEEFGKEQQKNLKGKQEYFDQIEQIDKELEGMDKASQESWKKLTGYYKLREQVDNEFEPGSKRYKKAAVFDWSEDKWKEYAAHPQLYDLMVRKKKEDQARSIEENKRDPNKAIMPIQPEFDERLSASFRKQLLQNKMVAPGDDAELDQRMYSSPEFDYYQNLKDEYKAQAKKYYPDSGEDEFTDELVKNQDEKFPTKPDILKKYGAAYAAYYAGQTTQKPEFTDQIKAAKEQWTKSTFDWTNKARTARGLPAITWEMWNNPTFGYDESKSGGFGFGFGKGDDTVNVLGELSNFTRGVERPDEAKAKGSADLSRFFGGLTAGQNPGRRKPTLGASARGQ